jgi:Leucine-rich repeat (LRR) protein
MLKRFAFILVVLSSQFAAVRAQSVPSEPVKVYRSFGEGMLKPDSVLVLDLSKQKRKFVPEEVRNFKNLRYLRLSKNDIRELPAWIGELQELRRLDLSNNRLRSVPPEIGSLKHLVYLGLNRNLIETLPPEIGNLSALEELELWDNELDRVPDEVKHLHQLKVFDLRGILFSAEEQKRVQSLLPEAEVLFSPPCNCKN